jgi:3-oxoacyl-[acyl-carrier protein] reductase
MPLPRIYVSDMTDQLSEEVRKAWLETIPCAARNTGGRRNVCVFLASEMSSYVSGQVIPVCGGMHT